MAGLGEVGDATDAARIEALAQSPSARVRRSALRALARLTGAAAVPRLVQALLTDARSVVAEARRLLGPHVGQLDAGELWRAAGARDAADALVQLLLLFKRRSKWERLAFVLDACWRPDARLGALALRELRLWLAQSNRSFTVLPPALRSELLDRLARAEPHLPPALAAEVGFAIRHG